MTLSLSQDQFFFRSRPHISQSWCLFLFSNVHFVQFQGVGRAETPGGLGGRKVGFWRAGRDGVGRAGTLKGLGCGKEADLRRVGGGSLGLSSILEMT